ncbi:MAG TPA: hypothetical protein VFR05_09930 [Terriglobia bacterium]|nr:hypothetical protein [Terriglobia bacterium]
MPLLLLLALLLPDYTQRGFVESWATIYPQKAANDSAHVIGEVQIQYEGFYRPWNSLQISGSLEFRSDTHHQTEREFRLDWDDRSRQRPMLSLRRLSAEYHRGGFSIQAGKQLVRWGRTDIVNPTDRFAPRDFLTVVENEFFGITALRGIYERGPHTIDVVWSPRLTPSRVPLPSQRWFIPPVGLPPFEVVRDIPTDSQAGIRWSYIGFVEFAAAFYSGLDHLPSYEATQGSFVVRETYPEMRMIGGDIGIPLPLVSVKGEAAYFHSPDGRADNYVSYVIQLERQAGEWFFVGGYGGETIIEPGAQSVDFNPVRGFTRTILARAGYTIDANRSFALETAIRQNFDGFWSKAEYSQAFGQHWRLTTGFTLIRGEPSDFLGQYRRNSHAVVAVRYSF